MADVKWIKMDVTLPDNRKIKRIRKLPGGNDIVLLWVFLLARAGESNQNGALFYTSDLPYTEEDLADDLISFSKLGSFDKAIKSLGNSYISKIMADVELKMKMVTTGVFIIVVSLILMFYSSGYDVQNGITDKMSSSTLAD